MTRLDRLQHMMENLVANSSGSNVNLGTRTCDVCGKSNHTRNWFKLKTCYVCNAKGHISRFCPKQAKRVPSSGVECHNVNTSATNSHALKPANCIMISLWPNSEKCDFLYDPGSKYSMITTATYDHLKDKLPISTTNLVGVSIQKVPFKLDGIIRMNCQFYDEKGDIFLLPSKPFLISDAIDSNIFGMHTEHLSFTIPMILSYFLAITSDLLLQQPS